MITAEKDEKLFYNIRRLRSIRRCNNYATICDENVVEHSYYVTMLAIIIAEEYNKWFLDIENNFYVFSHNLEHINKENVILKAMTHDIAEAFTGDIPWSFKHSTNEFNKEITERTKEVIDSKFEGCSDSMKLIRRYEEQCKEDFDGKLVALCDMLELSLYCAEEYNLGNKYMMNFLKKCIVLIEDDECFEIFNIASPFFHKIYNSLNDIINNNGNKLIELNDLN